MERIKTYVFSFDRPAQLYLLLESIAIYDIERRLSVYVQYGYSNEEFESGYEQLKHNFKDVIFLNEKRSNKKYTNPFTGNVLFNIALWIKNWRFRYKNSNFRNLLLESLNDSDYDYFMFLTDDSLFYNEILISDVVLQQLKLNKYAAYSLAAGANIKGSSFIENGSYIEWSTKDKTVIPFWTYAFSVDGRIYNRKDLNQLSNKVLFSNPNSYETILVLYHKIFSKFDLIYANNNSSLIGFELNRVQSTYFNNNMEIDQSLINKYFLQNYKLSIKYNTSTLDKFRPEIIDVYMINSQSDDTVSFKK